MNAIPSETAAGKAWLEKYLHPPSVQKSSFVSTPDNNISPVTTLNFETINNIPITGVISGTTYNFSDVFFLQTTGARVVSYIFVRTPFYNSGEWFQHPQYPAIINDSYDFLHNWGADVSMQRMSYKSCTYYLNATAFNDQGTITIAQSRPAFYAFQSSTIPPTQRLSDDFLNTTEVFRRDNAEFDYNGIVLDMGDVSGAGVSGEFVPATPTQVQQSNPKAVTHLARLGAFVPQHWSQPTNRFYNNSDTGNGSEVDLCQPFIRFITADKSEHTIRLFCKNKPDGTIPEPTLDNCGDTVWSDFTVAYVYFSALSIPSAIGQQIVAPAFITVKSVYGIEVQPHVKSAFVFFQQTPPVPDDKAIHIAAGIVHQKPDGYPSSANDFGSILSLVSTFAPKVIGWLSNAFGTKKEEAKIEKKVEKKIEKKKPKTPKPPRPPSRIVTPRPPRGSFRPISRPFVSHSDYIRPTPMRAFTPNFGSREYRHDFNTAANKLRGPPPHLTRPLVVRPMAPPKPAVTKRFSNRL